jgi:large subunit ribosomal protein L5e
MHSSFFTPPYTCIIALHPPNLSLLQGALDGGLDIPHNEKRLVGWTKEDGLEAEVLKKYIYGGHVAEYMEEMEEEDPEKYNR